MADKNQLKTASQIDFADDDPFAELTRIMGFDPRQPVKKAEPAQVSNAAAPQQREAANAAGEQAAVHHDDDFTLDLEKELLGGFDIEDEFVASNAPDPVAQVDELFADMPARHDAPDVDFDFSGDFDAALAAAGAFEAQHDKDDVDPHQEFEAAFAGETRDHEADAPQDEFDLGLTDDDLLGLGASSESEPSGAPRQEGGLDAAMADAAPHFGHEADAIPTGQEAVSDADFDFSLFDEDDFHLTEEGAPEVSSADMERQPEAHIEPAPEEQVAHFEADAALVSSMQSDEEFDFRMDESAFRVDDEVVRDEPHPFEETSPYASTGDVSFDDTDFGIGAGDEAPASEAPVFEPPVVAETNMAGETKPVFEFSVPAYVPRKLPTSPMDIAAEEVRQRNADSPAVAAPEFNLEDELNALLGNAKPDKGPVLPTSPAQLAGNAAPSYGAMSSHGASSAAGSVSHDLSDMRPAGAGQFDAPQPSGIEDDLNWDFDDAIAAGLGPEHHEVGAADQDGDGYEREYHDDPEPAGFEATAAESTYFEDADEPIDLDLVLDELRDHPETSETGQSDYGALAGMAALAPAAAGLASSVSGSPRMSATGAEAHRSASSHRDPVVRADPMKEDPLNRIAQLTEEYSRKSPAVSYGRATPAPAAASYHPENEIVYPEDEIVAQLDDDMADAFDGQPDIETIEVTDKAVALADDFDIPDLPEEEDVPPTAAYDDLDAEFSSLLNEMNAEPPTAQAAAAYDDPLAGSFGERPYERDLPTPRQAAHAPAPAAYADASEIDAFGFDAGDMRDAPAGGAPYAQDDYEFDQDFDQDASQHHLAAHGAEKRRSRGLLIAGLIAGVAVIGGIGALAFSFGGGEGGTPALVRADDAPVKVRPENPGGSTVPNQESKAYETVAGEGGPGTPRQESLVTTAEEPLDVTPQAEEEDEIASLSGKSEDRIEQIVQDAQNQTDSELAAVAPRRVRTMVVRPDGTLVPREDEPAGPSGETTDTVAAAPSPATQSPAPQANDTPPPALAPAPGETPAPAAGATPDAAAASQDGGAMPENAPIAPLRPADQPVDVVGEVTPNQVAAATTSAAPAGSWAMQIASQPSEAAAQSSYQDLARRYGNVLQGREVNIVRAEIEGRGTFWRVRVPANTRNEAISLCEQYKSAGGNCFVSR